MPIQKPKAVKRRKDDSPWKTAIEQFLFPMIGAVLPELYEDADVTKKPVFLDKELRKLNEVFEGTSKHVDVLAQLAMKDENKPSPIVIFHVEVQGKGGGDLPARIFYYNTLIEAQHKRPVVSVVILTGKRPENEGSFYEKSYYRCEKTFKYPVIDISSLDENLLSQSDNEFDWVLLAAKLSGLSADDENFKLKTLKNLIPILNAKGWDNEKKRALFYFTEAIIHLSDDNLIQKYDNFIENIEMEEKVMYITSAERIGMRKGFENGLQIGEIRGEKKGERRGMRRGARAGFLTARYQVAKNMLTDGFPVEKVMKYTGLTKEQILA